ncbi:MAG: hypothetical protein ACLVH0_04200 [Coprococcus eutactus]
MVPEELVQGGMFIKPDDFLNWNKGNSIRRDFNKEMLGNKHIFRASCGSVASSSSACIRRVFGEPNRASCWQGGDSHGR